MTVRYLPGIAELTVKTDGLTSIGHDDLRATVNDPSHLPACEELLRFLVDYITNESAILNDNDTMYYGYWMIKFKLADIRVLDIWEYKPDASDFIKGVATTLFYWLEQHETCRRNHAPFTPPKPDQKVAISEGVYEGDVVEGVRYPSPEHMSGWWLTTQRYTGDIRSLKVVHLYHITAARPDLAKLIALPYGFRFISDPIDVWFDENVARKTK